MSANSYVNYIKGLLDGSVGGNPLTGQYVKKDGRFRLVRDENGNPHIRLLIGGFTTDMTNPEEADREWLRDYAVNNPTSEYLSQNADLEKIAQRILEHRKAYRKKYGKHLPVVVKGYSRGGGAALELARKLHDLDPRQSIDELHSLDGFAYKHEDVNSVPKGSVKKLINVRSGFTQPIVPRGSRVQFSPGNLGATFGLPLNRVKGVGKQVTVDIPGTMHEDFSIFNDAADRLSRKRRATLKTIRSLVKDLEVTPEEALNKESD